MDAQSSITVPDGFTLHSENNAHILLASNEAFLNPIQEFNRDLSVACIRVWSEEMDKTKEARWRIGQEKKAKKVKEGQEKKRLKLDVEATFKASTSAANTGSSGLEAVEQPDDIAVDGPSSTSAVVPVKQTEGAQYRSHKYVILEALAATGLRSIRYAKEIPLVRYVIANDLSSLAAEAMRRNIEINGLGITAPLPEEDGGATKGKPSRPDLGKVRINEGDACTLMYNHREEHQRVDVVDLDPYGTAAPFIDAGVQCLNDGGLLCITCTDLPVLGTTNYPEKCFSNYGGVPVKAEYCHEAALRLVLHAVATSAARYGRFIQPLASLSIDFYVRLFIRIQTSPAEVKRALAKTSTFYVCTSCQSHYEQPLGKMTEKKHESSSHVNYLFKINAGPPVTDKCPECNSVLHIAGPMWSGPIQEPGFIGKVLEHLDGNEKQYGTSARMKGMLTVAKEELDTPFYFTPSKVASFFHCQTPSLDVTASALLHAGHKISRSHALAGSLKTTASREEVHDIFRSWIKSHPVKVENISDRSPAVQLLAKEAKSEANFRKHPDSVTPSSQVKLVRYQENPTAYWGPGTKAMSGNNSSKRKRKED